MTTIESRPCDAKVEAASYTVACESLQCLQAMSSSEIGILHLLRHRTPESLAKVIVTQPSGLLILNPATLYYALIKLMIV